VPKAIMNAQKLKSTMRQAEDMKARRIRAHSKPGALPFVAERKKHLLKEIE
jgi:hypothetical protein